MLRTLIIALLATAFAIPSEVLENNAAVDNLEVNTEAAPNGLDVNENFCLPCPFGGHKSSGHKSSGHKSSGHGCGSHGSEHVPVAPGPRKECIDIPDVKPSTLYDTKVREIVATRTVTDLKVASSVETLVQTLTKTHYSTHTSLSYPEQTETCTLTRKYVVWPGYTVTAGRPGYTEPAHVEGGCHPTGTHHW